MFHFTPTPFLKQGARETLPSLQLCIKFPFFSTHTAIERYPARAFSGKVKGNRSAIDVAKFWKLSRESNDLSI